MAVFLASAPLFAQSTGGISGIVLDGLGYVLPGTTITVSGDNLPNPRIATADATGKFVLNGLPVGLVTISIELAGFIYRKDQRLIDDVNIGVPFEQYEPVQALDPGLDLMPGTEDDQVMTVFNQSPDSLGQDRFSLTNPEGLEGDYTGLRLEARKLLERSWQMMASFSLGRSRGFLPGPGWESFEGSGFGTPLYDDPNTLINTKGRTFWDRDYVLRVSGSHADVLGFKLGGSFRIQNGQPLYRSIFLEKTLDGDALNQGIIEVLADPQGFDRHPRVLLIDARIERELDLGRYGRLGLIGDVFNLLNANTITELGQRGGTFGTVHEILAPRVFRIGLRYRF
jgi:hypothetical protein